MLRLCLCMLFGAYALSLCRQLPSDPALLATSFAALLCLWLRVLRLAGFALLGLLLVWIASRGMLADRLSPELQGQTLAATVRIADFPRSRSGIVHFVAEPANNPALPARIRLSWYDAPEMPQLGETWRLQVKLKRPRGLANPGGFDYELWLARQRIGATGYVVNSSANGRVEGIAADTLKDTRAALRKRLADRITALVGDNDAQAVLLAIAVGARHRISQVQWQRYAVSGTSHLMAISGLHIGLAAAGAWFLFRALLSPFCHRANSRILAIPGAMAVALLYTEISGFAVPARRAMLMALLVSGAVLFRRQLAPDRIIAVSCLAVFCTDPLAIHAPGFKLSFGAVGILLWRARQRRLLRGTESAFARLVLAARDLFALQFVLLFGLFPLTALIFGRVSWLAPAINLLVLPLFNVLTVPSVLLGLVLDGPLAFAGDLLIRFAWQSVQWILRIVEPASDWPPATQYTAALTGLMLPVVLLSAVWALAPPGFPGRRLAWVAAVSALLYKTPHPPPGCVELAVLEVGQGLATVLRSAGRVVVIDTGPSFRGGSDSGERVLVPWLRSAGIRRVDLLLVSHSDDDHAGGTASLLEAYEVTQISVGEKLEWIARPQLQCRSGQAWLWNGVRFSFIHPGRYPLQSNNNASCVLEVTIGAHSILFTGDIESPVENHLVRSGVLSPVDIAVVPHHGSRTSSRPAFVDALRPAVAIVSAGYGNRWGFPKEDVVARWQEAGARVMNTATSGAIHYRVCADSGIHLVSEHRRQQKRYWHDAADE
ncbi:MAG: DNA internalization-related competence protein ComEC/Rec2 [Woeseia sp.]